MCLPVFSVGSAVANVCVGGKFIIRQGVGVGVTAYHKCISEEIQTRLVACDIFRHLVEIILFLCLLSRKCKY